MMCLIEKDVKVDLLRDSGMCGFIGFRKRSGIKSLLNDVLLLKDSLVQVEMHLNSSRQDSNWVDYR